MGIPGTDPAERGYLGQFGAWLRAEELNPGLKASEKKLFLLEQSVFALSELDSAAAHSGPVLQKTLGPWMPQDNNPTTQWNPNRRTLINPSLMRFHQQRATDKSLHTFMSEHPRVKKCISKLVSHSTHFPNTRISDRIRYDWTDAAYQKLFQEITDEETSLHAIRSSQKQLSNQRMGIAAVGALALGGILMAGTSWAISSLFDDKN